MKKIVYFDEESVTDYLQISRGGNLEKTTELLRETSMASDADVKGNLAVNGNKSLSGFLSALMGFNGSAELNVTAGTGIKTNNLAKSIIQNTILTDFLNSVVEDSTSIDRFSSYQLEVEKDSLTYIVMISPFMSMISGNSALDDTGEYDLVIEKVDETIKLAKGYYEFVGKDKNREKEDVIFRFNISAFKNNYKITDLRKMDLVIHAIQVGSANIADLTFKGEFDLEDSNMNPHFNSENNNQDDQEVLELKVFDVLIAGVE